MYIITSESLCNSSKNVVEKLRKHFEIEGGGWFTIVACKKIFYETNELNPKTQVSQVSEKISDFCEYLFLIILFILCLCLYTNKFT